MRNLIKVFYTKPDVTDISNTLSLLNIIFFISLGSIACIMLIKLQKLGRNEQRASMRIFSKFRKQSKQDFIFDELELKDIEKDVTIVEKILISKENAYTPTYQVIIYDRDYDLLVRTMAKIGMLKTKENNNE